MSSALPCLQPCLPCPAHTVNTDSATQHMKATSCTAYPMVHCVTLGFISVSHTDSVWNGWFGRCMQTAVFHFTSCSVYALPEGVPIMDLVLTTSSQLQDTHHCKIDGKKVSCIQSHINTILEPHTGLSSTHIHGIPLNNRDASQ